VIQRHLVNPLAEKILEGAYTEGDTVEAVLDREGLINFVRKQAA
jgi:ATP-dependent Clp protease ATP-binding subunit ClpA